MTKRWVRVLRSPVGIVGVGLLTIVVLLAVLAPVLWGGRADAVDTDHLLAGPSSQHWFGTDNLGRDLFFRVLVATRLSLGLALVATVIGSLIGIVLGTLPWLLGGWAGRFVTAVVNVCVAFPGLLLVLVFAVIFGIGARGAALAIAVGLAPGLARLCETLVAGVASREYVAAARIAGVGRVRTLIRHVLPNVAEPLIVNITITAGTILLSFAGLSFLGLGVQSPAYDWGRLMQDGLAGIYVHPLAAIAPGIMVVLAGLAFNLTGEAIAGVFGVSTVAGLGALLLAPTGPTLKKDLDDQAGGDRELVLDVRDLRVRFPGADGPVCPVRGVSLAIGAGEAVGVVGESGSGKSLMALSIAGLIEEPGRVDAHRLAFCGVDLLHGSHDDLLGTSLAVVFQDPGSSFNPTMRVGSQLAEAGRFHQGLSRTAAAERAVDRLRAVRLRDPERNARQYPFEFSGGMRQRAMIGMGLMGRPRLIVADEPTTALDVTVQAQILDLLADLRQEEGTALLLISHDVSVVREVCDRVVVMYAGRIVEELATTDLDDARHPYTRALLHAVPDMDTDLDEPLATIPGQPVDPARIPAGCAYAARCPLATERCREQCPELAGKGGHRVACWHAGAPLEVLPTGEMVGR